MASVFRECLRSIQLSKAKCSYHGRTARRWASQKSLADLYESRPASVKALLSTMVQSLPAADVSFCGFCGLGEDAELDHYLPKSKYPEFAFHFANLMPICGVCNKRKGTIVKHQNARVVLAPFWDLLNCNCFLRARLAFGIAISADFELTPGVLPAPIQTIAGRHFVRLNLGERYQARARSLLGTVVANVNGKPYLQAKREIRTWTRSQLARRGPNDVEAVLKDAVFGDLINFMRWLRSHGYVT